MIKSLKDVIITDPTDQDVYKYSMKNFMFSQNLLRDRVEFQFFNRGKTKFPKGFAQALQYQINAFAELKYTPEMIQHISVTMPWLRPEFVDCYLPTFRYKPEIVHIKQDGESLSLIIDGAWGDVSDWETQLMAVGSELLSFMNGTEYDNRVMCEKARQIHNAQKFSEIKRIGAKVIDYGMRRRYSKDNQGKMLDQFISIAPECLLGTSNLMFAREKNLTPCGTYAHELVQYMGAKYGPLMANRMLLGKWVEVYNGALGIALPDTYTTDVFLNDFDLFYAKLYDGVREDSSPDPCSYQEKIIAHYEKLKIDSTSKQIVHSNGIDSIELIEKLQTHSKGKIKIGFGIGTWLTNDVYYKQIENPLKPVNWVIKMTAAYPLNRGKQYTVKLSDTPGKVTSVSPETVDLYKRTLNIR